MPSLVVLVHLLTASAALVVGAVQLARPKGSVTHRYIGLFWTAAMLIAALSSFAIFPNGFSLIHGISVWTLFALAMAFHCVRRRNIRGHRNWMVGTFAGLLIAFVFTFTPGRLMHQWVVGLFS